MTCLKKYEAAKGKTWSQLKKERENQKWHSPCKKPRLSIFSNNNLFTSLLQPKTEVLSETEFSDDLPDIDDEECPVSSSQSKSQGTGNIAVSGASTVNSGRTVLEDVIVNGDNTVYNGRGVNKTTYNHLRVNGDSFVNGVKTKCSASITNGGKTVYGGLSVNGSSTIIGCKTGNDGSAIKHKHTLNDGAGESPVCKKTSKPVVFDETAKAKIAALLIKIKQLDNGCKIKSKNSIGDKFSHASLGNNRHFLDVLKDVNVLDKITDAQQITKNSSVSSSINPRSQPVTGDSNIKFHSTPSTEEDKESLVITSDNSSDESSDSEESSFECQSESSSDDDWEYEDHTFEKQILTEKDEQHALQEKKILTQDGEEHVFHKELTRKESEEEIFHKDEFVKNENVTFKKEGSLTQEHPVKKCGLLRHVRVTERKSFHSTSTQCIERFFPVIHKKSEDTEDELCKSKVICVKQNRPLFPNCQANEDSLAASLSDMHINTIEAALEEGDAFLDYSLKLVEDFLLKPTESIVQEITSRGLLGNSSLKVVLKSGKLLSTIVQKYPTLIRVEWDILENLMGKLTINKDSEVVENLYSKVSLLLDHMCTCFQMELKDCKISNPNAMRRTQTYKLLSSDCAFANLKQIVQWICSVVTSDEYKELRDSRLEQHLNRLPAEAESVYVPKLLPNLQKLLEVGVNISRSCVEAAKRVGGEMVHIYMYLPDVSHKKLFLQSVTSDLLQFKVVQRILEDSCDRTFVSCQDFPNSLNDVIEAYFEALPPKSPMTPPQSPSDEENDPADNRSLSQFSASSCEELAFLVHCVTQSYLRCAQGYQHQPLSQRLKLHHQLRPLSETLKDSQSLAVKVSDFYGHLVTLTTELNQATHQYLMLLQSMANASTEQ